jgi:hypothetical protein
VLSHRFLLIAAVVAAGLAGVGFYLHHRMSSDDDIQGNPTLDDCVELQVHIAKLSQAETLAGLEPAKREAMLEAIARKAATDNNVITEQCLAGSKAIIDCMLAASDVAALRACIPR